MNNEPFRFKQFVVEQHHAALKVNTDAVLLGALAGNKTPESVLDIGTGTGVIALMLAQRFPKAKIEAVEIDLYAAETAAVNFKRSPFDERMSVYEADFADFLKNHPQKNYDMIVSNPPFFLDALRPEKEYMGRSKHTGEAFFAGLFSEVKNSLLANGEFWLILPPGVFSVLASLVSSKGWHIAHFTHVFSRPDKPEFRTMLCLKQQTVGLTETQLTIRDNENQYTQQYTRLLKDFLTIF